MRPIDVRALHAHRKCYVCEGRVAADCWTDKHGKAQSGKDSQEKGKGLKEGQVKGSKGGNASKGGVQCWKCG